MSRLFDGIVLIDHYAVVAQVVCYINKLKHLRILFIWRNRIQKYSIYWLPIFMITIIVNNYTQRVT